MPKLNMKNICTITVVALLIVFAGFLRNLGRSVETASVSYIIGVLRAFIYIGLFSVWGFSLHQRIIQTQARRFFVAISALMVFWVTMRALKFNLFSDTHIARYLWYLYYLAMLFIPVLLLFVALSLGKSEKFQLPRWTRIVFGVSLLLLILVLTNDFHQLVFCFPSGLIHFDNGEYTHQFGYSLIMCWLALCTTTAFVFIVVKCRVPYSKRCIYIPCVPLVMLIIYAVLYLTVPDIVHPIAGDMTIVICVMTALALEICIQCGLIQSNTHYNELVECTSIRVRISDEDYNILLSANDTRPLSKDVLRQIESVPVMLDDGMRLCSAPIKYGHVIWTEDVSEITEIIAELADNDEYLTTRRTILHKEVETHKEEQRLIEQNRLYNRFINDNQKEYHLFSDLISRIEATDDIEQEKKLTAKMAVVCTHIKRRGNLLFLAENKEKINAPEIRFALEEWLSNIRLCGVKCNLYFNKCSTLTFAQTVAMYDTFQWVLLCVLDTLHSLLVTVDEKDGELLLLLNLSCDGDLSKVSCPGVRISDEDDGEWLITIRIPKGGAIV